MVSVLLAISGRRSIVPFLLSLPFALVGFSLAFLTAAYTEGALSGLQPWVLVTSAGAVTWSSVSLALHLAIDRASRGTPDSAQRTPVSAARLAGAVVAGLIWFGYVVVAIALALFLRLPGHDAVAELSISPKMPCARYRSGEVACWPHRKVRFPVVEGAVSLSTSEEQGCAVRQSGEVVCWKNDFGTLRPAPAGVADAVEVVAGWGFQCARRRDGSVSCWGKNDSGQLGSGTTADFAGPKTVVGLDGVAQIAAGQSTVCAVRHSGNVLCWGDNTSGQLGDGTAAVNGETRRSSPAPVEVVSLSDARKVAVGGEHACAWRRSGEVVCWGRGGMLGDGSETTSSVPVVVRGLCEVADLQAGSTHACVRCSGGEVRCWGWNNAGVIAAPTRGSQLEAARVELPDAADRIDLHGSHSCARLSGRYWCWGDNTRDELGVGPREDCGAALLEKPMCTPHPAPVELW